MLQTVLDLVPNGGIAKGRFDDIVQFAAVADAVGPRTEGDVVVDAHRERVGLLEDHADAPAQVCGGHRAVDVMAVEFDAASYRAALDEVVHPVERLEQRRLAAAGWADEGRHLVFGKGERDVLERMKVAVVQVQVPHLHLGLAVWACGAHGHVIGAYMRIARPVHDDCRGLLSDAFHRIVLSLDRDIGFRHR